MIKYILIACVFLSCNTNRNRSLGVSTELLDTVKPLAVKPISKPFLFETAFSKGTTHTVKDKILDLYGITIGKIKITSGHIVACDPGHIEEYGIPFTQAFPNGEFPVQLAIAKVEYEEIIAFARINFSEEPVARWEFALQKEQTPIPVGGNKKYGYPVDLGVGIFIDSEASKVLDKNGLTELDAPLYQEMDKHYHNNWRYTMYNFGQHNLAAFTSGFGDGYYASYIGFDAKGNPCRLLTDFDFIDWTAK